MRRFISYFRVSTARQGRSGLGLDAQRKAVVDFLNGGQWEVLGEYTEIESGKHADRPELRKAMDHARRTGAVLLVAKLDRLSRDVHFLTGLEKAGVEFVACDMPEANRLTVHIMAVVAQAEREMISKRTKEALAAAKARGVRLGNPNGAAPVRRAGKGTMAAVAALRSNADRRAQDLAGTVAAIRAAGATSLQKVADELNRQGITTARGGRWYPCTVRDLEMRSGYVASR
jgi:DNA invertase Pin-like site-specific DNA recombinase